MKSISTCLLFCTLLANSYYNRAQIDSVWSKKPTVEVSGFLDVFYVYDLNQPQSAKRQNFLFSHNRHNEFNINLGLLKLALNHEKYRANIAVQFGTYPNDNYAAEPGLLKNIHEANIGVTLNKKNNLWLDAGVFSSHLGFESAVSIDNYTLTRSLCNESSPYFLSGAKLTYTPNEKLEVVGVITNGWQRIQRLSGNSIPSFGTQIVYKPSKKVTLNWSTFIGTDSPDDVRKMRYFSNLFGDFKFNKRFNLIAGFDCGIEQRTKNSNIYNHWFTPTVIGQITLSSHWKTSIRFEYFNDRKSLIIPVNTTYGLNLTGLSVNLDYSPVKFIMCRIEGRWLNSRERTFVRKDDFDYNNYTIAASLAVKFSEVLNKKP